MSESPRGWAEADRLLFATMGRHVVARIDAGALPPRAPDPSGLLGPLYRFLLEHRAVRDSSHARIAGWLASACLGGHHLWQDLGLDGRPRVTRLMRLGFPALHDANERDLRWKRHLFLCLGEALGRPGLRPPKCDDCGDFAVCMGAEAPATIRVVATITTRDEGSAASQGV